MEAEVGINAPSATSTTGIRDSLSFSLSLTHTHTQVCADILVRTLQTSIHMYSLTLTLTSVHTLP